MGDKKLPDRTSREKAICRQFCRICTAARRAGRANPSDVIEAVREYISGASPGQGRRIDDVYEDSMQKANRMRSAGMKYADIAAAIGLRITPRSIQRRLNNWRNKNPLEAEKWPLKQGGKTPM